MASVPIIELTQVDNGEKFYPLTHVDAVVGLDDLSFFTLDESGNVTLRPQYQNLWVPGWLAAGGVGTGGSGGGGLIETVYTWTELQAMASAPADDVTAAVNARGVYEIWQAVKALQNSTPNVSLVNGSGSSTITVNSVSAEFYTKGQVDNLIGGLVNFHYEFAASTSAVTNPQSNVLYLIGPTGSGADKYEEYVYTDSTWKKIGDTSIDVSQFVTALGTSGNYLTWTKNGTTNNITVPFATNATTATKIGTATVGSTVKPVYINAGVPALLGTVGTSTMPVYLNNGTITQISSFKEAYLSWGGKNFSASYGPIDAAMVSELGACRTMFTKAAAITIEYSTDGGTTWVDYGADDTQKMNLFSTGNTGFVIGHASVATASASNMLRVTLNSAYASIYTTFNKFVIFLSTNGSTGCYCTMRGRTRANYDADADVWTTFADAVPVSGWSGYNVINTGSITFGSNSSQIRQLQFIFGCTEHSSTSYAGLNVSKIFGFGGVGWTTPSNMAKTGHLYAYDALQNATFPEGVYTNVNGSDLGSSSKRWKLYATTGDFSGALTGTTATFSGVITTSSYIKKTFAASNQDAAITIAAGNYNNYIWALSETAGTTNDIRYGFGLKYIGTGSGNANYLRLMAGNSNGTPITSFTVDQGGRFALGLDATDTNYQVKVGGAVNITDALTLSGSTNTARRIYFGDSSHYLELDEYGFHFSHGVYSDDFVSAGGIGSSSSSGGSLEGLVDVELSESLDDGDLLKYDGTHWVNVPQSAIVPTVSVAFDDLTSHPTTLAGYGITDAKIENGVITLGGSTITPLTSVPDISNTYLSLANGGTVAGAVDFGSGISGGQDWSINDRGEAAFADLTVNGSQVLTSHQTVTNFGATLTPGQTITVATIGSTNITVQVPFFAMQQDIGTLNSYFTNGVANNAAQLDGHSASYFATAAALSGYVPTSRTINGVDLSANRTFYALGTSLGTSAARGTMLGVSAISYDLSSTGSEASLIAWDNSRGAWHVYGNLYADGWVASGGIGTESGGGGYGVESITSNQDGTVDFHFTGGDITTVDLNHEHPQYNSKLAESTQPSGGFLPDVVYELGTLTGTITFTLASAVSGQVNHYFWTFTAGSTAPTITWPIGITWVDSAPTITASKKYQISILDGVAAYMEA